MEEYLLIVAVLPQTRRISMVYNLSPNPPPPHLQAWHKVASIMHSLRSNEQFEKSMSTIKAFHRQVPSVLNLTLRLHQDMNTETKKIYKEHQETRRQSVGNGFSDPYLTVLDEFRGPPDQILFGDLGKLEFL